MRRAERPQERGAALLTVLLLVAVIAVLAGTALEKLRLATRVGGNAVALDQARAFSFAAETLAVARISALLARSPERVTLAGGWSGTPIPLPIPGGSATATIVDGGNCFNLNSLVQEAGTGTGVYGAYPRRIEQFARLVRLTGAPASSPDAIAAATADWIDSDTDAIGQGAEDGAYQGYRAANTLMTDPSELRAVAGVTPAVYDKLRPWICTLPTAASAPINVNTLLPERAALLTMFTPGASSVEAARQALLRRPPQGYATSDAFWTQSNIVHDPDAPTVATTKWFALKVDVALGGTNLEQNGLIDASTLPARLVSRQWGEPS